jgi:hypothetical protein
LATTLPLQGGWGCYSLHGNKAGAPRWGRNFCFINLLVAASGEPSYPRRQRRFPHEGDGAATVFVAVKPGLLVGGAIFAL